MKDEKNKQPRQTPQQQQHPSDRHPPGKPGQDPSSEDPSRTSQHQPHKAGMGQPMDVGEGDRGGDIENPDHQETPGKKVNIDDDPDATKKKVPNVHK